MRLDPALRGFLPVVAGLLALALAGIGAASAALRKSRPALARELWLRYLAWVVIAAIVLGALGLGRAAWVALVGVLSLAAFREFAQAVGLWIDRAFQAVAYLSIVLIALCAWWPYADSSPEPGWYGLFMAMPVYAILAVLAVPIVRDRFERMLQKMCLTILGIMYFGWLLGHLGYLVNLPGGVGLVLFLVFLVALNDVAAFVTGRLVGRRKLRPALSPGKTWEGAAGAVVAVAAGAWLLRWLVPAYSGPHLAAAAVLISAGSTLGDLALSVIKRDLGIKDWSDAIPGHGGVLDRVNSLVFTVPLFFHYTRYFFT